MKASFHKRFDKSYVTCPLKIQKQFKQRLQLFLGDPFHPVLHNHALYGEWKDFRSINITGDYRALYYHVNDEHVDFFIIDTHSNLYG